MLLLSLYPLLHPLPARLLLLQVKPVRLHIHHRLPMLFLPVQPAEIRLPADCDHAGEEIAMLPGDEGEAERRDRRPDLPAVLPAHGDGVDDALFGVLQTAAGEKGLHLAVIARG